MHVMVQGLVAGDRTLKEVIKTAFAPGLRAGIDALSAPVRQAGRALSELHASGAVSGPVVTWEAQVAAVRHASEELATVVPSVAGAVELLLARLEALALEAPAGPLVPTHRSFRPAQLLIGDDAMAMIDFDGFCQAEAGLDIALFRITLTDLCLRALAPDDGRPIDPAEHEVWRTELDELAGVFLRGYQEVGQVYAARLALWDATTGAKDILDCWRKIKFEHLDRRMGFLRSEMGASQPLTAPRGA